MEKETLIDNLMALRGVDLGTHLGELESRAERFEERDKELQAFLHEDGRFERLAREVEELHQRHPNPVSRPPLFGLLLGVKDCFRVDGFPTRVGSRLRADLFAGPEGAAVGALKNAGALILGKTVTTEFTYFAPGKTVNPHQPNHTPGGSSSGSAAAVGAGLCALTLGTQTIASVIRPAAYCGVVGFKPSAGRIPADGLIHLAPSLDQVGFFAPDAMSAMTVSPILVADWRPASPAGRPVLGVPEGPYLERASPEGLAQFRTVCERLEAAGYRVVNAKVMADFHAIEERHCLIVATEAERIHRRWRARYKDLYAAETLELLSRGESVGDADLRLALSGRAELRRALTGRMSQHGVDLWITPAATGTAPEGLESTGDPVMSLPFTHAGLPSMSMPSGVDDEGLPFGLQLVGRYREDEALLAWSGEIEAAVHVGSSSGGLPAA